MASTVAQSDPEQVRPGSTVNVTRHARGAVIAKGNKALGQGRSTHMGGDLDNTDVSDRYTASLNAEIVAMSDFLAKNHGNFVGCTIYCSTPPNWLTWKNVVALGIKRIVHYGPIEDPKVQFYSQKLGVETISAA